MSATKITIAMLSGDVALAAKAGTKIFAAVAPQKTAAPYVLVSLLSEPEGQTLAGATGQFVARISVSVHAPNAAKADEIGELIKACMGNRTNFPVIAVDAPGKLLGIVTSQKAGADLLDFSDDLSIARRIIDFDLRWQR